VRSTPFLVTDLLPHHVLVEGFAAFPVYRLMMVVVGLFLWEGLNMYSKRVLHLNNKRAARAVALSHAFVACVASTYVLIFYHQFGAPLSYCVPIPYAEYVFPWSFAYFLWDLVKTVHEGFGADFVVHASLCLFIYSIVLFSPCMQRCALMVLFYEISTVFLHSYVFLFHYKFNLLGYLAKFTFAVSFFVCRIVVGTYVTYEMWSVFVFGWMNTEVHCVPKWIWQLVLLINALFHLLNLYWFTIIISSACRGAPEGDDGEKTRKRKHKVHPEQAIKED